MRKAAGALFALLVLAVGGYMWWARGLEERIEADSVALFVPVVVTPSLQLASGQVLLYKATNVLEAAPTKFRLMLFTDDNGVPFFHKDFTVEPGTSVSHVYEPPMSQVTLGTSIVQAPQPVRAVFAPVPADDPGAIRRIVANVQIMRVQPGSNPPSLEPPIFVPLERCRFEPRGFVPYTGGRWFWNCAPEMSPIAEQWRSGRAHQGQPR